MHDSGDGVVRVLIPSIQSQDRCFRGRRIHPKIYPKLRIEELIMGASFTKGKQRLGGTKENEHGARASGRRYSAGRRAQSFILLQTAVSEERGLLRDRDIGAVLSR